MYIGETLGEYEVSGKPADPPKREFMLAAEWYGCAAFAQTRVWPSPIVDERCCIIGEGMYVM